MHEPNHTNVHRILCPLFLQLFSLGPSPEPASGLAAEITHTVAAFMCVHVVDTYLLELKLIIRLS